MRDPIEGPSIPRPSGPRFTFAAKEGSPDDECHDGASRKPVRVTFSARESLPRENDYLVDRYRGALEMLRNQLWNGNVTGNISFEEGEPDESTTIGHMVSRETELSQIITIERGLCSNSSVFLKRLLMKQEEVPLAVLDAVLSDEKVMKRLKNLNENFSFGRNSPIPKGNVDDVMLETIKTATSIFNGSTVPAVMWPCTNNKADHNEKVRIDESVVLEALQIYRLLKHNRKIYIEWGRNISMTKEEEGALPMDVTDPSVLREASDTIIDELTSTMWCISCLSLHMQNCAPNHLLPYANVVLEDHKTMTSKLWGYFLAFSAHIKERHSHIKDIDRSLNDKLPGRLIVEVHRMLTLQSIIIKTLLAIHMGTRSMTLDEYQRYSAHFQKRQFTGVLYITRNIIGSDQCRESLLLTHAVQELQTLGTLLLSSFFLNEQFGPANVDNIKDGFFDECSDLIRSQMAAIDSGKDENRASPILIFAYACFMKNLPQGHCGHKASASHATNFAKYMYKYSESFEWIAYSRDIFGSTDYENVIESVACRMVMMLSISQFIEAYGVEEIRRLDGVVGALSVLAEKNGICVSRKSYLTNKMIMERISEYLVAHFPFGMHTLFQLIAAFLPSPRDSGESDSMDIDSDAECMEVIIRLLRTRFKTMIMSPTSCTLEPGNYGSELELCEDTYVGIQMLYMLGFNKQMLIDNWHNWNMGYNLSMLKAGSVAKVSRFDSLKHLSHPAESLVEGSAADLWLVDACVTHLAPSQTTDRVRPDATGTYNVEGNQASILGCKFELGSATTCHMEAYQTQESTKDPCHIDFTLLNALWLTWNGSIRYMVSDDAELTDTALQCFVTCNSLMTSLISKYPRISSLIESHIISSLYSVETGCNLPFGPCNLIFNYTLLLLICLKKPQLRIMLPDVINALRNFLVPGYVVPVGDNAAEVEFARYWIFFQSLESCSYLVGNEKGLQLFNLLSRVMQEEERHVQTYPVTESILKLFKELLQQCPPELWMLSGWHHGMLNMSHTSLEMESNNLTHGLGLSYLRRLKCYIDSNKSKSCSLYSPFQSLLLCEMFGYVLKHVAVGIAECEFANYGKRFEMISDTVDIVHLICKIFRVYNYETIRLEKPSGAGNQDEDDSWAHGLNELVNRNLLILSESNYILEIVSILAYQIDILYYHHNKKGAVVMTNSLSYSEKSLSFFTPRTMMYRRMGLGMMVSKDRSKTHARLCLTNCKYSWLSKPESHTPRDISKEITTAALGLLRELYVTALPKNRNPLFNTLAETLGSAFFVKALGAADNRRRFLVPSHQMHDMNDPVIYYAMKQLDLLCVKVPQVSFIQSLFTHTYSARNLSVATDIVSLYILLRDQSMAKSMEFIEHEVFNERVLLQKLGNLRGKHDVIALVDKERACFHEHLICVFFESENRSYEAKISVLQYLLVSLSTCSGMELLVRNKGMDISAITEFIDSVLRYHIMEVKHHNLGDVTLAQYALLIFTRLVELSKGAHDKFCWKSVNKVLRKLINIWRRFDSNVFVDSNATFGKHSVIPRSTMAKELWFDRSKVQYYMEIEDSIEERRLSLLRTMGSLWAILGSMTTMMQFSKDSNLNLPEDFLELLAYVSMNWDFMDALFPIVVYDSGFVDTYVKNDFTETNMRQYHRLGLWLGEDCLAPLSRFLHYLHDMNVQSHYLLMPRSMLKTEPMDMESILRRVASSTKKDGTYASAENHGRFGVETFIKLLGSAMGPPEANGLYNCRSNPNKEEDDPTCDTSQAQFYTFGTAYEFGYNYLTDVEKLHHFCVVLLTSKDDELNYLLSREMRNIRQCAELVPYIESISELKIRIISRLCDLVKIYRDLESRLKNRIQQLVTTEARVGMDNSMRMAKCTMQPFEMFVFNGAMMLQLVLTRPDCITEYPMYAGFLLDFMELLLLQDVSLSSIENGFITYYQCCGDKDNEEGGIVNYIVSRDKVSSSDKVNVGQEFRMFAVNVFGGLVAQVTRYINEFTDRYQEILDADLVATDTCRASLKVRIAALETCLQYQCSGTNSMSSSIIGDYGSTDDNDRRGCVCRIASGNVVKLGTMSVWLHFKMIEFFSQLYGLFSYAAKSGHESERDSDETILEVYHSVSKYTVKRITECCKSVVATLSRECEYILECFMDAGTTDFLKPGELERIHVFVLFPFALSSALESIMCNEFNKDFVLSKGYTHIIELAEALARLPYTASMCVVPYKEPKLEIRNEKEALIKDRNYMVQCILKGEQTTLQYENHNWLRAAIHRCLQTVNLMMMHTVSCSRFVSSVMESQVIQRSYLCSFLGHFVEPLQYVNPKILLSKYSEKVTEFRQGDCVDILENNIALWYPPYQVYQEISRCPYHLLHCGILKFSVEACNLIRSTDNVDKAFPVSSWVLELLHLLRKRIKHALQVTDLTLAYMEECSMFFSLLRHVKDIESLSEADAILMKDIVHWSLLYFSNLVAAFQNGVDKISYHVQPKSQEELDSTTEYRSITLETKEKAVTNKEKKQPGPYQQRCLYLMLKSVESFVTFLMGLRFTLGCEVNTPPTMASFVKSDDTSSFRRMCPVSREGFTSVINGGANGAIRVRQEDEQPCPISREITFETMMSAFNVCVDLCALCLRLYKELQSVHKPTMIFAFRSGGKLHLPLSLRAKGAGEYTVEIAESTKCAMFKEAKLASAANVDVAPISVLVSDVYKLLECVIEKSVLFSAQVVNTAFLQNQLGQKTVKVWEASTDYNDKATAKERRLEKAHLQSTVALLNNALVDIRGNSNYFSTSMVDFCGVMEKFINRRIEQSKLLAAAFKDKLVYLERR